MKQDVKKKGGGMESRVYLEKRRVKWLSLNQLSNGAWQMKYQYLKEASGSNIYTENYGTLVHLPTSKNGREELELVEKIETTDGDWMWQRQIKRGIIQ